MRTALAPTSNLKTKDLQQYSDRVISHSKYQEFITLKKGPSKKKKQEAKGKKAFSDDTDLVQLDLNQAKIQLNEMHSRITIFGIKSVIWYFNKTMRHALAGLHVDLPSVNMVKQLQHEGKKVILMPIYKSFADSFIYIYIHNHFNLETPFLFGNKEDTPDIKVFEKWLKMAGYIYSRRSFKQSL